VGVCVGVRGRGRETDFAPAALQVLKISHFFLQLTRFSPTFYLFALLKAKKLSQFNLSNIFPGFSLVFLLAWK